MNPRTDAPPTRFSLIPGLVLCLAITLAAYGVQAIEIAAFGRNWIEALVLAILLGTLVRTLWTPGAIWQPGIGFSAKLVLEIAVVLLGASISAATILAAGPGLLAGIIAIVGIAIVASYGIGRALGLPQRMAILIACGNAICGNSAIAAIAPVIGADGKDVASSIAFTAVLGVVVVLALPLLGVAFGLDAVAYGALAGLTVYAVPQVIAAAAPFGVLAIQLGTLVKLVRVLTLGPVCLVLGLIAPRLDTADGVVTEHSRRPRLSQLVPWFIIGFIAMIALRSFGAIPAAWLPTITQLATWLTVIAMAALGLGVDVRTVARAGAPVVATVIASLVIIAALSLALIFALRLG
ncbi:putative sulfate exporter family transporter [Sphingorhabdus soli]|uniref:Putative sulfate exporter family transporter n=1 Tax=Flavisphingopyxis soli TaxID=2601267 RepID=A0A5C6U805_9SPHN|nr:putative sulfate exporter family transporter [Sphingorhabdus soli]TXC68954.1 putative sulfate exporter family transporter [Sphingorhabdus soli]